MVENQGAIPLAQNLVKPIIAGQIRHLVTVLAGILVSYGALQSSQESQFVSIGSGIIIWAIVAAWSWWQKVGQAKLRADLASLKPVAKALILFAIALGALAFAREGWAAELKAPAASSQPFSTATGSGWYVGVGTEGALAASSVTGTTFPGLTLGNLTADGGTVGIDVGYIWGNCFLGTWCQVEFDGKYQNIGGTTGSASVNSLWSASQEFDVGAQLLQTIFSAVGNLGTNFPTFNPTSLLPSAVAVATTPRQYFGFVADEYEIGGAIGSASGQTWGFAPGLKTGYRWQTLGSNGQPNDGSLNVYAEILFPTKGADINGVFASPGGTPLSISGNAEMSTMYLVGIHYDFGL